LGVSAQDDRVKLVQGFSIKDIQQCFYDSDDDLAYNSEHSDRSGYNSYDSEEYYDMHCDDCD
jgi:hypothetical protein